MSPATIELIRQLFAWREKDAKDWIDSAERVMRDFGPNASWQRGVKAKDLAGGNRALLGKIEAGREDFEEWLRKQLEKGAGNG